MAIKCWKKRQNAKLSQHCILLTRTLEQQQQQKQKIVWKNETKRQPLHHFKCLSAEARTAHVTQWHLGTELGCVWYVVIVVRLAIGHCQRNVIFIYFKWSRKYLFNSEGARLNGFENKYWTTSDTEWLLVDRVLWKGQIEMKMSCSN